MPQTRCFRRHWLCVPAPESGCPEPGPGRGGRRPWRPPGFPGSPAGCLSSACRRCPLPAARLRLRNGPTSAPRPIHPRPADRVRLPRRLPARLWHRAVSGRRRLAHRFVPTGIRWPGPRVIRLLWPGPPGPGAQARIARRDHEDGAPLCGFPFILRSLPVSRVLPALLHQGGCSAPVCEDATTIRRKHAPWISLALAPRRRNAEGLFATQGKITGKKWLVPKGVIGRPEGGFCRWPPLLDQGSWKSERCKVPHAVSQSIRSCSRRTFCPHRCSFRSRYSNCSFLVKRASSIAGFCSFSSTHNAL